MCMFAANAKLLRRFGDALIHYIETGGCCKALLGRDWAWFGEERELGVLLSPGT